MARKFLGGKPTVGSTDVPVVLTSDSFSALSATTSAELAGVISDETGSGSLVFATSPTLVTPTLGAATATTVNGTTIPSSKTLVVTTDKLSALAATSSSELAGVISDETGSGALVFGTTPTIATPLLTLSTTTSNSEGRIAWDATNDQISVGDGAAQAVFGKLGSTNGVALGAAAAGTATTAAKSDHVHPTTGVIPTTLIDNKGDLIVGSADNTAAVLTVGTNNHVLTADSTATYGVKWAAASGGGSTYVAEFSKSGTLATGTGTFRWYNDSGATRTIGTVRASVGTAPTGASLIVDVNVGGTTIYSTQANRPTIAASANTATGGAKGTTTIADGGYFTVDIDQVGSTVAGSDLTVLIWLS